MTLPNTRPRRHVAIRILEAVLNPTDLQHRHGHAPGRRSRRSRPETEALLRADALMTCGAIAALLVAQPAFGTMGTITSNSSTHNSITVDWSGPSGTHRSCGSAPRFQICFKSVGALTGACASSITTDTKPYQITGLSPTSKYKIKVFAKAEKQNWRGNWRNCELRRVGVTEQNTRDAPAAEPHLSTAGATATAITVRLVVPSFATYDSVHIAYKRKGAPISLHARCMDPIPFDPPRDHRRGYLSVIPVPASIDVEFDDLSTHTRYKVVAYLFTGGFPVLVNEITAETDGSWLRARSNTLVTQSVEHDFEPIAIDYLVSTDALYGGSGQTLQHLKNQYSDIAADAIHHAADGEDFLEDSELLAYLVQERPEVFAQWQRETEVKGNLTMSAWLADQHPALLAALLDEIDVTAGVPGPAGLLRFLLAAGLLLGALGVLVSRRTVHGAGGRNQG